MSNDGVKVALAFTGAVGVGVGLGYLVAKLGLALAFPKRSVLRGPLGVLPRKDSVAWKDCNDGEEWWLLPRKSGKDRFIDASVNSHAPTSIELTLDKAKLIKSASRLALSNAPGWLEVKEELKRCAKNPSCTAVEAYRTLRQYANNDRAARKRIIAAIKRVADAKVEDNDDLYHLPFEMLMHRENAIRIYGGMIEARNWDREKLVMVKDYLRELEETTGSLPKSFEIHDKHRRNFEITPARIKGAESPEDLFYVSKMQQFI